MQMGLEVDTGGIFEPNVSLDYGDYEYQDESELRASPAVWIPLLYLALLLTGLLGNGLLLVVLFRKWRSWSIADIFVLHLCTADLLLLLTLPLLAAQAFQSCGWCFSFGLILCKISRVIFYLSFYCGIFLLVCIVLDRYLFFCRTTQLYSNSRPLFAHVTCLCVWICSLILVSPKWAFVVTSDAPGNKETLCVEKLSSAGQLVSRLLHHALGFLLPAAILILCCARVALVRGRSNEPHRQRAFMAVLCLVVVFLLCWMPYNISLIVDTAKSRAGGTGNSMERALKATSLFGYIHTCLRPPLHLSQSANLRSRAWALLRCAPVEPVGSLWEFGVGEDEQTEQNHKGEEQEQMTSEHQMQTSQC